MKRHIFFSILACLALSGPVLADPPVNRADNEVLYRDMLSYARSLQGSMVGDPVGAMLQNFIVEVQAAHLSDPYVWMEQSHQLCNRLEKMYPPVLEHSRTQASDRMEKIRKGIFLLRDYPRHEQSLPEDGITPNSTQVSEFHRTNRQYLELKRDEFFRFLSSPRPSDGSLQIAKLYSSGFVFRTKNACIALDICYETALYSTDRRDELIPLLDAFFLTHGHGDHYDLPTLRTMTDSGKPVVMPKDVIKDTPGPSKLIWPDGHEDMMDICPSVKAQAGITAQGNEPCLMYIIQIDNWRIAAVGDNSYTAKEVFYEDKDMVDVLCSPIFQGVQHFFDHCNKMPNPGGVAPVYISAHEDEYTHTTTGRITWWNFYANVMTKMTDAKAGHVVVMDNGENLTMSK